MDKQKLLKRFSQPEEKLSFSKALDQAFVCETRNIPAFTEFLDPVRLGKITDALQNELSIKMAGYGGGEGCERRMIGFFPDYMEIDEEQFPIASIEITGGGGLTHRDYLGSILGTGIDRGLVGDIFIFDNRAVAFVSEKISGHVCGLLTAIGRKPVHTSLIKDDFLLAPFSDKAIFDITVSSLRIDSILSKAFNMSRGKSAKLIEAEKAYLNWICIRNPSKEVKEGDIITLRGSGRMIVKSVNGVTKKGNISLTVERT